MPAELNAYAPALITREQWQARPPLAGLKPQQPSAIILHHTATRQNPRASLETKLRNLQSFSQKPSRMSANYVKPAWPDVPYHYYIDVAGRIGEGRDVHFAGDTNTNYNPSGHIQVVIEGEFDRETPTPAQLDAVRDLLVWLSLGWSIPVERISTHKDHASTSCPGRNFLAALPRLRASVTGRRQQVIAALCQRLRSGDFTRLYCR